MPTPTKESAGKRLLHGAYTVMKIPSLLLGFPLALLAVMALVGLATSSLWVQALVALVAVLGGPLLVADRLLPSDVATASSDTKGLVTDVLAVSWVAVAVLVLVVAFDVTGRPLRAEARLLDEAGFDTPATAVRWLVGSTEGGAP